VEADDAVKVVVITGRGEYYSSGGDFISETAAGQTRTEETVRQRLADFRYEISTVFLVRAPFLKGVVELLHSIAFMNITPRKRCAYMLLSLPNSWQGIFSIVFTELQTRLC